MHSLCRTRSEPYDPYVPRNGGASGSTGGNAKTAAIQAQIDDTVGIMRENITKVAERGERLDSLQDKTGAWTAVAPIGSADGALYLVPPSPDPALAAHSLDGSACWHCLHSCAVRLRINRQPRGICTGIPSRCEPGSQGAYCLLSLCDLGILMPVVLEYVVCA